MHRAEITGCKIGDDATQAIITVEPLAFPIETAAHIAGVSRTRMFDAVANKELTARKPGKATIIELPELRRWIRSLPTRGRTPAEATET